MTESLHMGRIRGIRIGINWSLLPIFFLLAWSLADTLLPAAAPGFASWGYWVFGLLTTAAFYASLLAHELAHALVARRHGVNVKGIVLWVFGGVAQMENDSPSPRAEFELTAAGPATSLALAAAGLLLAAISSDAGASPLLVASLRWLGEINVLLALFNLLPAFPLDGGRILRAALWRRWGDRMRATAAASRVGRIGGYLLIGAGALELLFGVGPLSGIWLALVGWFITMASAQQYDLLSRRAQLRELVVADAMSAQPLAVPANATVAQVVVQYVRPSRFSSFPVLNPDGGLAGLATVARIARLPRESWATASVLDASANLAETVQCGPQDRLTDVVTQIEGSADRRAVVIDGRRVVGILTASDVKRVLQRSELFTAADSGAGASAGHTGGFGWTPAS